MPYTDELLLQEVQRISSALERIAHALENAPTPTPQTAIAKSKTEYCSEKQAAEIMGLSVAWFQRMRVYGGGPPFTKMGRAVRYRVCDLHAFMALSRFEHTTEADARRKKNSGTLDN